METKIFAFTGKGGVGKTSLSAAFIRLLSEAYPEKNILAVDADPAVGLSAALGMEPETTLDDVRLERPMPVYSRGRDRFDIWLSRSPDLVYWGRSELVLGVEDVPWANDKIGPTASPVKTEKGGLTLFHAVDRDESRGKNGWETRWTKRYTAGLMLLDLKDPAKVLSVYRGPLIAPDTPIETDEGFRENVIFPCGMVAEDDGEVKIYYGASDTCVCLATAKTDDLLALLT